MENWLERTGIIEEDEDNNIRIWGQRTLESRSLEYINIRLQIFRNGDIEFWTSPSAGTRRGNIDES